MNNKYFQMYEKYMLIIGPVKNFMFFLQAYKIFFTQNATTISFPAFLLSLIGAISWLSYGMILKNFPLIMANIVGVAGAVTVLIGTFLYG